MSLERRQYLLVRWAMVGFAVLTLGLSVLMVSHWWTVAFGSWASTDCGCQVTSVTVPTVYRVLGAVVMTASGLLWVRLLWFGWASIKKSDQTRRTVLTQPARHMVHQPTGLVYWLVQDSQPRAMTLGWWRPAIYLTSGMMTRLTAAELATVLRHEQAHGQSFDPLWAVVLETIGQTFGWLPWLRDWATASYGLRELVADEVATSQYRRTASLSSAIIKLADQPSSPSVIAFSPNQDRVEKLLNDQWHPTYQLWRSWYVLPIGMFLGLVLMLTHVRYPASAQSPSPAACREIQFICRHVPAMKRTPGWSIQPPLRSVDRDHQFVCFENRVCVSLPAQSFSYVSFPAE